MNTSNPSKQILDASLFNRLSDFHTASGSKAGGLSEEAQIQESNFFDHFFIYFRLEKTPKRENHVSGCSTDSTPNVTLAVLAALQKATFFDLSWNVPKHSLAPKAI